MSFLRRVLAQIRTWWTRWRGGDVFDIVRYEGLEEEANRALYAVDPKFAVELGYKPTVRQHMMEECKAAADDQRRREREPSLALAAMAMQQQGPHLANGAASMMSNACFADLCRGQQQSQRHGPHPLGALGGLGAGALGALFQDQLAGSRWPGPERKG